MSTRRVLIFIGVVFAARASVTAAPPLNPLSVELNQAAADGDLNHVNQLLAQGVPINGTAKGRATALMEAASAGHLEVTKRLIEAKADLDQADGQGSTALLHACSENHTDCALALIDAGANPNRGSDFNRFPLMYAAEKSNDAIVADLIAHKADLNANCNDGSAIYWATSGTLVSTVKLLADAGANLNLLKVHPNNPEVYQVTLLGNAAFYNHPDMVELLIARGCSPDSRAPDGSTPLMNAAEANSASAVATLVLKGAKIDLQDNAGRTALMIAAMFGGDDILAALIDNHPNLNLKDARGETALMFAVRNGKEGAATKLVIAGEDIDVTDSQGETALTHAADLGQTNIVDFLRSKGAKRTDLHIISKGEPTVPLPLAEQWALAVGASYTQRNGMSHKYLGGNGDTDNINGARIMLKRDWNVHNKAQLLKQIDWLRTTGQRERYDLDGVKFQMMSDADFNRLVAKYPDRATQIKASRDSFTTWQNRTGLAWDLCRASMLVNNGVEAHMIGEKEAWPILMSIAQDVQKDFSSWKEMADNFLDGRLIWDSNHSPKISYCTQLLLDPKDPNSPWNYLPWNTDLSKTQ